MPQLSSTRLQNSKWIVYVFTTSYYLKHTQFRNPYIILYSSLVILTNQYFIYRYWAVIDDALRKAAFDRGVEVHMMASIWEHTQPEMISFLKSLNELNNISTVNIEVVRHVS